MITPDIKAAVIARLKRGFTPEDIAVEYNLPTKLIAEWQQNLTPNDLVHLHANMHAAEELANGNLRYKGGEVIESQEKLLKGKLEEVAVEIIDQTRLVLATGDIVRAKTLQLCSDSITKMYATFITKGQPSPPGGSYNPSGMSVFQRLMKD